MSAQALTLNFPQPLAEKYRPRRIEDFVGLDKPKRLLARFCGNPFPSAWLFVGPSGTGKTSLALAMAEQLPAELHHIPSKNCDLATVENVCRQCHYAPRMFDGWKACPFHLVLVDEADSMSPAAQMAFLSKLDATAFPPGTIFVFTCNATTNLESRFLSRCRVVEFSSYGMNGPISELLERVWTAETSRGVTDAPNFSRIAKEANNNTRDALMSLEMELMSL